MLARLFLQLCPVSQTGFYCWTATTINGRQSKYNHLEMFGFIWRRSCIKVLFTRWYLLCYTFLQTCLFGRKIRDDLTFQLKQMLWIGWCMSRSWCVCGLMCESYDRKFSYKQMCQYVLVYLDHFGWKQNINMFCDHRFPTTMPRAV